jgi:hypothetical protein
VIAVYRLKSYESPGIDKIAAELIQAGSYTLPSDITDLFNFCLEQ